MGIADKLFRQKRALPSSNEAINTKIRLINDYNAQFTVFSGNIYDNDIVRSCIDAIASNTAKLNIQHIGSAPFNNILLLAPNRYMSAYDFIYKIVSMLYTKNNVFIEIKREVGKIVDFVPIDYVQCEFSKDGKFIYFTMQDGTKVYDEYDNLIHLRRHFNEKSLYGSETLTPIAPTIEVINTANQGIVNAVKSSARLRGLLKFSQVLRPEDVAKHKNDFAREYLGADNDGGIAALDAKADFQELKSDIKMIDDKQIEVARDNIYRYFGISENIVKSSYTEDEFNAFYSSVVEPIAIQMSLEFTRKIFSEREISTGNKIVFSAERLTFANNNTKANLINVLLPLGVLSINEARTILELSPIDDGDRHLVSLNYVDLSKANEYQLGKEEYDGEADKTTGKQPGSETE